MWEYKLVFKNDRMAEALFVVFSELEQIAGFHCQKAERISYEDHYFDSEDLGLDSMGIVCRARRIESSESYGLLIKRQGLGPNKEPIYMQTVPVVLDAAEFRKMLEGELPENFGEILQVFLGNKALRNLIILNVSRTVIPLASKNEIIAHINLDRFEVFIPQSAQRKRIGDYQYEVEIKTPPGRESFPEADVLHDYLRNAFNLIPIAKSKARRFSHVVQHEKSESRPRKVILDMDTGVDDALAILLAMQSPELEVLGITAAKGNIDIHQAACNCMAVLKAAAHFSSGVAARYSTAGNLQLPPVAPGRVNEEPPKPSLGEKSHQESLSQPIVVPKDASDVHGPDGIGGTSKDELYKQHFERESDDLHEDALTLFRRLVAAHESGSITLITTGPLTNLAHWIDEAPESVKRLREVVCMGGVFFESGNRSQAAEFNIHADPKSARKVVEFCRKPVSSSRYSWSETLPVTFIGLDVTHKVCFRKENLTKAITLLREQQSSRPASPQTVQGLDIALFIEAITRFYMDFYYRNEGLNGCYLHDPLAVGYVIDPSICQVEQYHVEVEDGGEFTSGMTVADYRPTRIFKDKMKEVTRVCYKVDAERFEKSFFLRVLGPLCLD